MVSVIQPWASMLYSETHVKASYRIRGVYFRGDPIKKVGSTLLSAPLLVLWFTPFWRTVNCSRIWRMSDRRLVCRSEKCKLPNEFCPHLAIHSLGVDGLPRAYIQCCSFKRSSFSSQYGSMSRRSPKLVSSHWLLCCFQLFDWVPSIFPFFRCVEWVIFFSSYFSHSLFKLPSLRAAPPENVL